MKEKSKISKKGKTRPTQLADKKQVVAVGVEDVTPILEFLSQFRQIADPRAQHKSKLISIKIPEPLLAAFRYKASRCEVPYQAMIKRLMVEWLAKS